MDNEKMFYNAVAVALQGDPSHIRGLKKKCGELFGGWEAAFESLGGYDKFIERERTLPDPEIEWWRLEHAGIRVVLFGDTNYPALLREIHDPPLALYVRGEWPVSASVAIGSISIVGTRRGTPEGKATTKHFARELAEAGFVIVSGLALGIDAAAHVGCLEASDGKTIAVLAGGLENFYPGENQRLGEKILERGGAAISEYPIGEPPYGPRFLERNRIVCGLSKGVLVVEAPQRSGSLATANFALQQNRDLFVVPGPITHPNFFGSHELIRQGATLVTKPDDILEAYGITREDKIEQATADASDEEKQILIALRSTSSPMDVDKIIEITKLEPRVASRTLSFLLLKRLVKETGMGYIIE